MKILIAGDWHSFLHEEPLFKAFQKLGYETLRFSWYEYFTVTGTASRLKFIFLKIQNKYTVGPVINKLNKDLIIKVRDENPNLLLIYRGSHIYAKTLQEIRKINPTIMLVGYNNDDPFSPAYPRWTWRHFIKSIPEYDLVLAYRTCNIEEYRNAGASNVKLLRSWYDPELNHPIILSETENVKYQCDVAFIGHYEDDGRIAYLEEIYNKGYNLKIYGHEYGWHNAIKNSCLKDSVFSPAVWGDEYNKALCGAKIALCFYSKLNRDTYTRRCFEIPATRTMLITEHSNDIETIYKKGVEADYFKNKDELIMLLEKYLSDEKLRNKVSDAGYQKLMNDGHDVISRARQVINWVEEISGRA